MKKKFRHFLIIIALLLAIGVMVAPVFYNHSAFQTDLPAVEHIPIPPNPESWDDKTFSIPNPQDFLKSKPEQPASQLPPLAWKVQVTETYKFKEAMDLVQTLRENGLQAYTEGDSMPTTLSIGPFLKKEQAESVRIHLDKQYKLKSTIIAFEPITSLEQVKESTP